MAQNGTKEHKPAQNGTFWPNSAQTGIFFCNFVTLQISCNLPADLARVALCGCIGLIVARADSR
jgi:hypothetical protein